MSLSYSPPSFVAGSTLAVFDGGFHNGITMLKVTFTENGYLVVGDDMDDADATVSFKADSVTSLLEQVSKLN